jgi:hypothetical protein
MGDSEARCVKSFSAFVPESFESCFAKAGLLTCFQFLTPSRYFYSGFCQKHSKLTAAGTVRDFHPIPFSPFV